MRLILLAMMMVLCGAAQAGPWLRAEGETFLSFSMEMPESFSVEPYASFYLEHGLRDDVTLGFDLGGHQGDLYKAILFARMPITRWESKYLMAWELGIGTRADKTVLRPGFSIGRGWEMGKLTGWMAADSFAHFSSGDGMPEMTTDLTLGVNLSKRSKLILQLQSGYQVSGLDYMKFAPSVVFENKPGQHVELGVLAGIENSEDIALKLGLWRNF